MQKYISNTMKIPMVIALTLSVSTFAETAYKSVDEEGNVIFTDKPSEGAEEIKLNKAQTLELPATKPFKYSPAQKKEKNDEYTRLEISVPANDSTVHSNDGKLAVNVSLEPALKQKDKLVLYLDGQQVEAGNTSQFSLNEVERGTHNLSVVVMSTDGKILHRSKDVIFHLRKASVLSPLNKNKKAQPEAAAEAPAPVPSL